jgi:hypothetical protein
LALRCANGQNNSSTSEIACAFEAPVEHRPGAPSDSHVPGLDHLEREPCRMDQVAQFISKESESIVLGNGFSVDGADVFSRPYSVTAPAMALIKATV